MRKNRYSPTLGNCRRSKIDIFHPETIEKKREYIGEEEKSNQHQKHQVNTPNPSTCTMSNQPMLSVTKLDQIFLMNQTTNNINIVLIQLRKPRRSSAGSSSSPTMLHIPKKRNAYTRHNNNLPIHLIVLINQ